MHTEKEVVHMCIYVFVYTCINVCVFIYAHKDTCIFIPRNLYGLGIIDNVWE